MQAQLQVTAVLRLWEVVKCAVKEVRQGCDEQNKQEMRCELAVDCAILIK